MKKLSFTIILLVVVVLFAAADYYLNQLDNQPALDLLQPKPEITEKEQVSELEIVYDTVFKLGESVQGYTVSSQSQTNQIFEKIDLSKVNNVKIYKNLLKKPGSEPAVVTQPEGDDEIVRADETVSAEDTIFLYEIHGPAGQGSLTYLNVKLQFIAQVNAITENINEDSSFGDNSFFFNDDSYKSSGFLLTQVEDNIYGFQYSKNDDRAYGSVQAIVEALMPEATE